MATEAKEGDAKVTDAPPPAAEEAPKHTAAEEAKEEAKEAAGEEEEKKAPLTDEELLRKHYPRYFYDKKEKHFPVDLNRYTANKAAHPGINGVAAPSKDGKHTWLIYMSYFLWDGGVPALGGKGSHKHDLEIVIVEIKNNNQRVMRVFYAPHSSHEHMWIYHRDDVKEILDDGGRPRVFVSLGKHASYPISGKVTRLFGLGTDQCIRPQAKDRPLFILNEHTKRVDKIDGQFQGPRPRIHRDWSTAPGTRLNKVRKRRAVPPAKQVRKQLEKTFAFWKK